MDTVFAIHRELGRLWNENIYQNELAYRCQKAGFEKVETEVAIKVSFQNFFKIFYIDLLLNNSIIYELKTVSALTGEHYLQTLNYLLLSGMQRGKLINMRPVSVKSQFVSTNLLFERRFAYTIDDDSWQNLDGDSLWLKNIIIDLAKEWGVFLDINLYSEAISHLRGGEENVVKKIEVINNARIIGNQKVHLLNDTTAFKITAMTRDNTCFMDSLQRFITFTSLKAIQWINFNHDRIELKTILAKSF